MKVAINGFGRIGAPPVIEDAAASVGALWRGDLVRSSLKCSAGRPRPFSVVVSRCPCPPTFILSLQLRNFFAKPCHVLHTPAIEASHHSLVRSFYHQFRFPYHPRPATYVPYFRLYPAIRSLSYKPMVGGSCGIAEPSRVSPAPENEKAGSRRGPHVGAHPLAIFAWSALRLRQRRRRSHHITCFG